MARFLADPKVARWLERYPPEPADRCDVRQGDPALDGSASGRARRGDRARQGRGRRRPCLGGVDGPSGRVEDGARARRLVRRQGAERLVDLDPAERRLLPRPRRPAAALLVAHASTCSRSLSFGLSLWFFNRGEVFGARRSRRRRSPTSLVRTAWIGFRGRACDPALSWPVWLLAAVAVFLGGLRIGLNLESPRGVIDVGYAGVIGGDRILDGQAPYGHMPVEDDAACLRPGRRRRRDPRPDPGRTAAASRRTRAATRTARSRTSSTSRRVLTLALVGQVGLVAGRTCDGDRVRPARRARPVPRRPPLRRAAARRRARLRLARISVHRLRAERELERRDHARDPRLGLLALRRRPSRAAPPWPCRAGRSSPRSCSRRSGSRTRTGCSRRTALRFAAGIRRSRRSRCSRSSCSSRASSTPCAIFVDRTIRLPARPRLAVLALGLGPVPRTRHPRPRCRPGRPPGRRCSRWPASWPWSRAGRARSSSPP